MRFLHPVIQHGGGTHPVHGAFTIRDGVIEVPEVLGLEMGLLPAPPLTEPVPDPEAAPAPTSEPAKFDRKTRGRAKG